MNLVRQFFLLCTLMLINIMQASQSQRAPLTIKDPSHNSQNCPSPGTQLVKILKSPEECFVKMTTWVYSDGSKKIRTERPDRGGYHINYFNPDPTKQKSVEFHRYANQDNDWIDYFNHKGQFLYAARITKYTDFDGKQRIYVETKE